ncbi:MAG: PepSY domain-containing protein [Paracoccaceae bacterium]
MPRSLHRVFGLAAAILIVVLTLSGAALSVLPAVEKASTPKQAEAGLSVADLAGRILDAYPGVEEIRRAPTGRITAFYFNQDGPGAAVIDPATGQGVADYAPSGIERWLTELHRSLFLGDSGRLVTGVGAFAMLALSISGLLLLRRRVGGWGRMFRRLRGPLSGRLHTEFARLSVAGLLFSALTALFMTAGTFGLIPRQEGGPALPAATSGQTGMSPAQMEPLRDLPLSQLRDLTFPYPDDATDVFTVKTDRGEGYLDQGTGEMLAWSGFGPWQRLSETIYMLHTGRGAWALGLILGLMALGAPVMAATGTILWWNGRRARPRLRGNAAPARADTVILVGSEGGSTWGFAAALHKALTAAGHRVHAVPLGRFAPTRYSAAERIIVMTATYGDGEAPASARGFLDRLSAMQQAPAAPLAILGFGDRQFPDFCGFAQQVARLACEKGWGQFLQPGSVDRQSPQDFARWGHALGQALGHELELSHQPRRPRAHALTLISRRDYGGDIQAPSAILRFALPRAGILARLTGRALPAFAAGDLLCVLPQGSQVPRFYSLASARRDGFVEICVSKHSGGLCSGQLLGLSPGATVSAFIRRNPGFRPSRSTKPVVLIGAGTGIGPLAGFARANRPGREMHLYFGARHADTDLLYETELRQWQAEGRLSTVRTAFSRAESRAYVQDILHRDAAWLAMLIKDGAQVLVCGGRDMAAGVKIALEDILAPAGLSPAMMKAEGRYVEDVY